MVEVNVAAIRASVMAVETAYGAGNLPVLREAIDGLADQVQPLEEGPNLSAELRRLNSGRSAIPRAQLDQALGRVNEAVDRYETAKTASFKGPDAAQATAGSGVHGSARRYLVQIAEGQQPYTPRTDQTYIAQRAGEHFSRPTQNSQGGWDGPSPQRGLFRLDTGMGKSLTYGYCLREMRKKLPEIFDDAVVIMGTHQAEPAAKLAAQHKALFSGEGVSILRGGIQLGDLKGVTHVVGTYQQLAQEGIVDLLKAWAGRRRILFVLDEADMVVWKGKKEADEDKEDETGWHASWFRPLIAFGLFNEDGRYNPRTRHYMLGASATLDRPDGIPLSTVWGPGNVFYHTPMAQGVRKRMLVPVVGRVLAMDVPEGADLSNFREFTRIENGRIVVDKSKVMSAAGSDYAVKTSVRAVVDHMIMATGPERNRGKGVRRAIGYVLDKPALEKHMRWQQDLFDLMETVFLVRNGLASPKPMRVDTIVNHLGGGPKGLKRFGEEVSRFLYSREWKLVQPHHERAMNSLANGRKDGVSDLFDVLYEILQVEARRIKGQRLVAAAVWQDMEEDDEGHRIPRDPDRSRNRAIQTWPNRRWPNGFGDRDQTFWGFHDGEVDAIWSIGMLDRGFDEPMASLIIDNAPTQSRRMVVQRAGRIMRPPDGRNPQDHSKKPEAIYVTVTANLEVHQIDLDRTDLARIFGTEIHPEFRTIRISPRDGGDVWKTPDTAQLDLGNGETVHLVRVGANTSRAVAQFLQKKYGDNLDLEVVAYDAETDSETIHQLLMAIRFPKEKLLEGWLKKWGADDDTARRIMATYHSDLAEMKTVYGGAWRIVSQPAKPGAKK